MLRCAQAVAAALCLPLAKAQMAPGNCTIDRAILAGQSSAFHRNGKNFPGCHRCDHVAGAGVCPPAGTLANVMLLFERIFVLCFRESCRRHEGGYWPPEVQERVEVFRGEQLDEQLAEEVGGKAADLLKIGRYAFSQPSRMDQRSTLVYRSSLGSRHRLLALLASLQLGVVARRRGLSNFLFIEGDVRPTTSEPAELHFRSTKFSISPDEVKLLGDAMRSRTWSIIRLGGHVGYYSNSGRIKENVKCPEQCRCRQVTGRVCEVAAGPHPAMDIDFGSFAADSYTRYCMIKETTGVGVHSSAFARFAALRRSAISRIRSLAQGSTNVTTRNESDAFWNASFTVPWFDQWVPGAFDNWYILPALLEQQVKQGTRAQSVHFQRHCVERRGTV